MAIAAVGPVPPTRLPAEAACMRACCPVPPWPPSTKWVVQVGGSIGVAVVSTLAASGIESGSVGGFTKAFTVCTLAAAASAAVGLTARQAKDGRAPHVH
ncbi:hypothetical protein [Streptomyces sp. HUAS ZL42]|uniref:hypothetical protein n=1 Tax=Streptomyces sp. HUAS ZL42 TaxID=3231715 RepID=UPI00345ECDCE